MHVTVEIFFSEEKTTEILKISGIPSGLSFPGTNFVLPFNISFD